MKFYGARSALSRKKPLIILLEGNMGAGKSTFLELLSLHSDDIEVVLEPVMRWSEKKDGENLLARFYADPVRWAFTFQSYVFVTRAQEQIAALSQENLKKIVIMDRSVYCDKFCFAKNCFDQGLMSETEWDAYRNIFSWIVTQFLPRPDGVLYLRASSETCLERIRRRGRPEEKSVSIEYVESLGCRHDDWLLRTKHENDYLYGLDMTVLDANCDFEHDDVAQKELLDQSLEFCAKLQRRAGHSTVIQAHKHVCGGS